MSVSRADSLRSLHYLSEGLRESLEDWLSRQGTRAPQAARALAKIAIGIASRMKSDVEIHYADLSSGHDVSAETIVGLAARVDVIEDLHAVLERSTYASLHPVLSPTIRHELHELKIGCSVLATGTNDPSYELWTYDRDSFADIVDDESLDDVDWPLRVFRVPHPPLDWPLHHVLIYHELGHAAYTPLHIPTPIELILSEDADLVDRMRAAQTESIYRECMTNWMEEVFADTLGVLLAGPAYALAFCRFLGSFFPLDVASSTHPPLRIRISLIKHVLDTHGYTDHMPSAGRDLLNSWAAESGEIAPFRQNEDVPNDDVLRLLIRDIRKAHVKICAAAANVAGSRVYAPSSVQEDAERGRWIYGLGIPSIEVSPDAGGEPLALSPARIFSAAWMAYLHAIANEPETEFPSARGRMVADVLLGSLEGADAIRAWKRGEG